MDPLLSVKLAKIARAFYAAYATPLASQALAALDAGDWEGLVRLKADPTLYSDPYRYYADVSVCSFLKKFEGEIPGIDRKKAATAKWWDAEKENYWTNQRLLPYVPLEFPGFRPGLDEPDEAINAFFGKVRKKVEKWIGTAPPELVEGRFGPGSTIADRGQLITVPDKMTSAPTLTSSSLWYLPQWLATDWGHAALRKKRKLVFVRGNRFATAPKTALTDRAIGIEPSINVFYQLGYGRILRKRLRNATGWDLNKAQDRHRLVAMLSSVSRAFATLDLSNASDTVCRNLVRILVPRQWVFVLEALRSSTTEVDGKTVYLEKFSSMGNGFTFELETILFAAIASTVLESTETGSGRLGEDLFVFGDDIIVPERATRAVTAALNFCGFTVNKDKSFSGESRFRESCGGDFFDGRAVRPFFLKDEPRELTQKYALVNSLTRLWGADRIREDPDKLRCWRRAVDLIPRRHRLFGPSRLGDSCINSDDSASWKVRTDRENGTEYIYLATVTGVSLPWHHWTEDVALASLLYGVGEGSSGVIPRDPESVIVEGWTTLHGTGWEPPLSKVVPKPHGLPVALGPRRKVLH